MIWLHGDKGEVMSNRWKKIWNEKGKKIGRAHV